MVVNKFDGETIEIGCSEVQETEIKNDADINEKYLSGEVRIVTEQARYPLDSITNMLSTKKYELRPDFQRRRRWNRSQQSRLIESFIMNIPIPPIFLYEYDYSKYEVMDGLQRLTAIKEYYEGAYPLEGLEYWKELNGRFYNDLPEDVKAGIDRRYLSSVILLKETADTKEKADKLKQLVFDRINSGGAKLEYQESRNALYPGKFMDLAMSLSEDSYFRHIFGIPTDPSVDTEEESEDLANNKLYKTMGDVELVIRFFATRFLDSFEGITLRTFLDKFTDSANKLPDSVLKKYSDLFKKTIKLAFDIYGDFAFRLYKDGKQSVSPVKILYDPVMAVLSQRVDNSVVLLNKKEKIIEQTKKIMSKKPELFNGRNTSKNNIEDRIVVFDEMLKTIEKDE